MRTPRLLAAAALILAPALTHAQGTFPPSSGPTVPTMKTLTQIEPRTDIATLAGTATAVVSLTEAGSYYLSGNIAGAPGKDTIVVTTTGVALDLNGFTVTADPARTAILGTSAPGLTVRNGRLVAGNYGVRGAARLACADLVVERGTASGITGTSESQIERCRVTSGGISVTANSSVTDCVTNGLAGVTAGAASMVVRSRAVNGGILAGNDAHIIESHSSNAPFNGIQCGQRGLLRNCTVAVAGRSGFLAAANSRVSSCSVTGAGAAGGIPDITDGGFSLTTECTVEDSTATQGAVPGFNAGSNTRLRSCTANGNTGGGFKCDTQARLSDCTAYNNVGLGISAATRSVVSGCIINGNTAGGLSLTGVSGIVERTVASGNSGGAGLRVDSGTVRECEVRENLGGPGIRASTGSTIIGNTSSTNGLAALPQNGFLIEGGRSRVEGNHAYNNTGFGLQVTNVSSTNSVLVIGNSAGSNDSGEYSLGSGNAVGPIVSPSAVDTNNIPTANFNL